MAALRTDIHLSLTDVYRLHAHAENKAFEFSSRLACGGTREEKENWETLRRFWQRVASACLYNA